MKLLCLLAQDQADSHERSVHCRQFSPRSPGAVLLETTLIQQLKHDCLSCRVTLLEAPPGFGKSFVLSALYHNRVQSGTAAVWVSLSETDNDLAGFSALLLKAWKHNARPGRDVDSLAALYDSPLDVFVDNLEYYRDPGLGKMIDRLLSSWPDDWRLWLASSRHVEIDIVRYETESTLCYLQMADLCFTLEDIRRFMALRCELPQAAADLQHIYDRTLGWPLAVSLLASILQTPETDRALLKQFSGRDISISSFLRTQLLACLDDPLLEFLYKIAPLPQLNYDLCRYATGDARAAKYLERLLAENCFLIILDRNGQQLVFHPLARETFIIEAEKNLDPLVQRSILERACLWFWRNKDTANAVECALAARSVSQITSLLHDIAPAWVGQNGGLLSYITWVERAKQTGAVLSLESEYWYLWALLYSRKHQKAFEQSTQLWQLFAKERSLDMPAERESAFRRRFEELRILISFFQDENELAGKEALKWLDNDIAQNQLSMATVACCVAINASINFDFNTARQAMSTAQSGIALSNSEYGAAWVAVLSAQIDYFEGDYRHAIEMLTTGLARATDALGSVTNIISTMQLLMASCLLKTGRYDEAWVHLMPGLRFISLHGVSEITFCGIAAALDMWDGSQSSALAPAALGRLVESYPPPMGVVFHCLLIRRLLRMGHIEEALYQAKQIGMEFDHLASHIKAPSLFVQELIAMTRLEYFFSLGMHRQALSLAGDLLEKATINKRRGRIVELEIMIAIIAFHSGDQNQALHHIYRAIRFAAKQHIVHPFLVRIDMIHTILALSTKKGGFIDREEKILFQRLCDADSVALGPDIFASGHNSTQGIVATNLTARELELMHLVDGGLSNQQIADCINVSITTVKWHLSNIYVKLNVRNRTAALATTRALKLL
ncbi:LuxR C-terminal-related transcriptional regulator [Sodalis sp. dw_96]|uniref:LuxR C-terminal-related transcriptional regulator n=1 Tax=Sodalis sp. dw_96 TaxID=2719794 RepID=UPI001BD4870D|nr:LuxR C-terminal-related transcriptional regulator [Sodalis sp. dw_96]